MNLYINNGNLRFTESSAQYGLNTSCATTQSAFFDYDHDGDLDCYILNQSHHPHAILWIPVTGKIMIRFPATGFTGMM